MIQAYLNLCKEYLQFAKDYGWKVALVIIPLSVVILIIMKKVK